MTRESWIHFERGMLGNFAAREIEKRQKRNMPSPYVTLFGCLGLFLSLELLVWGEIISTESQIRIFTLWVALQSKWVFFFKMCSLNTMLPWLAYLLYTNPVTDFWDPVVLNIKEYLIYSMYNFFSQLILCSGWFFYSSQGWTKEVTWKHLSFLRFLFFFQPLRKEWSGKKKVDKSVSFLKHWLVISFLFSYFEIQ